METLDSQSLYQKIVGSAKNCNQNGDKVSKRDKSCHIWTIRQKCVLVKYVRNRTLSIDLIGQTILFGKGKNIPYRGLSVIFSSSFL